MDRYGASRESIMFRVSLRFRIFLLIAVMAALSVGGTIGLTVYTFRSNTLFSTLTDQDIQRYTIAQDMELALKRQVDLLTKSSTHRVPMQSNELESSHLLFVHKLEQALDTDVKADLRQMLQAIDEDYAAVTRARLKTELSPESSDNFGLPDHLTEQRELLLGVLQKCKAYKKQQWQAFRHTVTQSKGVAERLGFVGLGTVLSYLGLTTLLIIILLKQVFRPVRMMALETGSNQKESAWNEVQSLSSSLHDFIEDFDSTHKELVKSREHLEQAEKMAMVGKLAAGVAHSIRNPFTSIKMRLFSLSRNLDMNEAQTEDLEVIAEEIGRIDSIVQSFLEFARPPKIRMRITHTSEVVQSVLTILKHRLQAFSIEVRHQVCPDVPAIAIDPEQLQEALINLVINACEAMEAGGVIEIIEGIRQEGESRLLALEVRDTGPGVSEAIKDKVDQPFFTTKEEGTGLGLSIVARIVEEHCGRLEISSVPGEGARFTILIPLSRQERL